MVNQVVLYIAAAMLAFWGVAHLVPTKNVVAGFGGISPDNRRIITMEWIVEGVALLSLAAFVAATTATQPVSAVYAVAIGTLLVLAVVSLLTGFRVAMLPFKLCPVIFTVAALLIAWGAWL